MIDLNEKALEAAANALARSAESAMGLCDGEYDVEHYVQDATTAINAYLSALTNTSGDDEAPVAYVCEADIRHLANQPDGTDMSIAPRPFPEYGMKFPLYARPQSAAVSDEVQTALEILTRAAAEVAKHGATTGPQWVKLNMAIIKAKSALHSTQEG